MKLLNLAWSNSEQHQNSKDKGQEVVILDMDASSSTIKKWKNKGRILIGYISAGSREDWRDDFYDWPSNTIGKKMDWPGEYWINLKYWKEIKPLMTKRMKDLKRTM